MRFQSTSQLGLIVATLVSSTEAIGAGDVTSRHPVSLVAGGETATALVLTNTHSRSYTDLSRPPMTPNRCDLAAKDVGVVWKVVVEGVVKVPAKDIGLADEQGRPFQQICWSSSGTVYSIDKDGKRTGGGPQTEFLAVGPEAPKRITLRIGTASAVVSLPAAGR